jgi:hypothetical protein
MVNPHYSKRYNESNPILTLGENTWPIVASTGKGLS